MDTASIEPAGRASLDSLRVVIVGHVDHGKSTLVGRLLHETNALPEGKVEALQEACRKRGMPFEWAFVTDAFQAERDQGITIDVSHIRFASQKRAYALVDAPGHRAFLRNMISGAADCAGALVVIDAVEGVSDQTRRHGYLLHLLGIQQIAVAVTKMDMANFEAERFAEVEKAFRDELGGLGIVPSAVIPVSGRDGDNLTRRSDRMNWYSGPTVVEALDAFEPLAPLDARPLRIPVQDVYKFDTRRIIAGRIEAGRLKVGDAVLFSPSNQTTRVKSIEGLPGGAPIGNSSAGRSVGFTLEEQIFVERGEVVSHTQNPPVESSVFRARMFWFGKKPMQLGRSYTLRLNTTETPVEPQRIDRVIDTARMAEVDTTEVPTDSVADVVLRARRMLAFDLATENARTGRFVLSDGGEVVGGGLIDMEGYPDQRALITRKATNLADVEERVSAAAREARNGHAGGVLWFTGLSGAGKSTLANELERRLFEQGYQVTKLDGDDLRHGLNANLGFSPEDRAENIRRVGEVASLFARNGFLVVTAFISPYRADRDRARQAVGERFHEVYVSAGVAACEARDPRGLYKKARSGEIRDFTGISAPYEPPQTCELTIDTEIQSVDASLDTLIGYVARHFPLKKTR